MLLRAAIVLSLAALAWPRETSPAAPGRASAGVPADAPYRLVWSDEFDRDGAP